MNIGIFIYRARIGVHRYRLPKAKIHKYLSTFELLISLAIILYRAGDVEKNPGPEDGDLSNASFSVLPIFQ